MLVYATYAKTFKTGGINQNGVPLDAGNQPILSAATIQPETVHHFELGLKTQFLDRRRPSTSPPSAPTIDDYQATVTNGQLGVLRGYLANADQVRTQGVEVDFSVRPAPGLTAYVNGAYTDAELRALRRRAVPARARRRHGRQRRPGAPSPPGTPGGSARPTATFRASGCRACRSGRSRSGAKCRPQTLFGAEGEVYLGVDGSYRSQFSSNPSPSIYTESTATR